VEAHCDAVVSLGDFVLQGGEVAAMAIVEAVARLVPGVVGNAASLADESHAAGLVEYPHYTRPREFEGVAVPDVLLSGDHGRISTWRKQEARRRPEKWRPDLVGDGVRAPRDHKS
jgi:tRNA (guanine37-N1)-methyltransferase